jgi:hypothetical protein
MQFHDRQQFFCDIDFVSWFGYFINGFSITVRFIQDLEDV